MEWTPLLLSFKLATITTFILFWLSLPIAYWLAESRGWWKPIVESVVALPIVLPPSVLGFYLLLLLSPEGWIGQLLKGLGVQLLFTFPGLVVGSLIYSLPFMVQPLQRGFEGVNRRWIEASYIAGKGRLETLYRVILPNMKGAILTGIIITFAHTIGEFGVVLIIGGAIPGKTEVASVAIYNAIENLDYTKAHHYSSILLLFSFVVLLGVHLYSSLERRKYD
jgi:molybdate transport system permease protein